MKQFVFLFFLVVLLGSCQESLGDKTFKTTDGKAVGFKQFAGDSGLIIVFISPECPLCQNYTKTLNQIYEENIQRGVNTIGIISGQYTSKKETNQFIEAYSLKLPVFFDPHFFISNSFQATTTPEVVLLDSLDGVKYQGAIDNWAISLGQKRLTITAHYLRDAVDAYLSGNEIETKRTKPIGCYIE